MQWVHRCVQRNEDARLLCGAATARPATVAAYRRLNFMMGQWMNELSASWRTHGCFIPWLEVNYLPIAFSLQYSRRPIGPPAGPSRLSQPCPADAGHGKPVSSRHCCICGARMGTPQSGIIVASRPAARSSRLSHVVQMHQSASPE